MFMLRCVLFAMVRAGEDPPMGCETSPHAATCVGDVAWNPRLQRCECVSDFPLLEFVAPSSSTGQTSDGRVLQENPRHHFDNCYPGQQRGAPTILTIGILADLSAFLVLGSNMDAVNDVVGQMVRYANEILEDQFDIRLRIEKLHVATPEDKIPGATSSAWIYDVPNWGDQNRCTRDVSELNMDRLEMFKRWINQYAPYKYAVWHLVTACKGERLVLNENKQVYTSTFSGIAYAGGVCAYMCQGITVLLHGEQMSYNYNTFIHEVGHTLGAQHTFLPKLEGGLGFTQGSGKGIMDYGGNRSTGERKFEGRVQFHDGHHGNMCGGLSRVMQSDRRRACWDTAEDANTGSTAGEIDTDRPVGGGAPTTTMATAPPATTTKASTTAPPATATMGPSTHGALEDTSAFCPYYATKDTCAIQGSRQSIMCQKTCARLIGADAGKKIRRGTPVAKTPTGGSNCLDERSAAECAAWEPACKTDVTVQRLCRKTCGMCGGVNARSAQTQEDESRGTALLTAGILVGVALVVTLVVTWVNYTWKIRPRLPLDADAGELIRRG